jgi:hypothetical protein
MGTSESIMYNVKVEPFLSGRRIIRIIMADGFFH